MPDSALTWPLGTMITHGFDAGGLATDLAIAQRLGAALVEVLPHWQAKPDPRALRVQVEDAGLAVHSAHGCWGSRTIRAERVDLGARDSAARRAGVDDLKRCLDWLRLAGGTFLVVHPGGLSDPGQFASRRAALADSLVRLANHAANLGLIVCVENMPPGVHPGTRMADLAALLRELDRPELGLALDTGHAHLSSTPVLETLAAGAWLRTTHVHDNNGRQDTHHPPGLGTLDWLSWPPALKAVGYRGPILLECIRYLRDKPESLNEALLALLQRLTSEARAAARLS
jgi:sugar phosphate isomerase/epimerase